MDARADHGVRRLLRVGRTVSDLPRALAFYRDALGFEAAGEIADAEPALARLLGPARVRSARLKLGIQEIELLAFDPRGLAYPNGSTAADLWFQHIAVVTPDIDAAHRRAQGHGSGAITSGGPQRLPPEAGSVTAFKFRDPDGHPVELIEFPRGAGASHWHRQHVSALTIGYDHSAINVADVERSVAFYTRVLGMCEASRQLNRSAEQDRLDGMHDVEVDVVALHPREVVTPHLELLAYHHPRGRAALEAPRPEDIASDRLVFEVANLDALIEALEHAGSADARPASVIASDEFPDGSRAALVRDPDGHLLMLCQEKP